MGTQVGILAKSEMGKHLRTEHPVQPDVRLRAHNHSHAYAAKNIRLQYDDLVSVGAFRDPETREGCCSRPNAGSA